MENRQCLFWGILVAFVGDAIIFCHNWCVPFPTSALTNLSSLADATLRSIIVFHRSDNCSRLFVERLSFGVVSMTKFASWMKDHSSLLTKKHDFWFVSVHLCLNWGLKFSEIYSKYGHRVIFLTLSYKNEFAELFSFRFVHKVV